MRKFHLLLSAMLLLVALNSSCKQKDKETSQAGAKSAKQEASGDQAALDLRVDSGKRLSKFVKALLIYSNDNKDKFPDSLDSFSSTMLSTKEMQWLLDNVEYLGRGVTVSNAPGTVLAYDKTLLQKGSGTNVLFLDTRVAFVEPDMLKSLGIPAVSVQ
jgi:hypothetical protein